jgi:hypothetical protein
MTNKEMQEKVNLLRRLQENGVPLGGGSVRQKEVLLMRQVGAPWETRAFDLGNGAVGYIANTCVEILISTLTISDIYLRVPWSDNTISLLVDPVERVAGYTDYRFYGKKGKILFGIEREQVLNHRLIRPGLLSRRIPFQGVLLWTGMESIPDAFQNGGSARATIVVYDQVDNPYPFQFNLAIDRRYKLSSVARTRNSRGRLFAKPDLFPK